MIIKIENLIQSDGRADYKGLDLEKIQGGTQVYPHDENIAFFYYNSTPVEHEDVEVITEEQYEQVFEAHKEYLDSIITPEKEIEKLKSHTELQQSLLDDLLMNVIPVLLMGGEM